MLKVRYPVELSHLEAKEGEKVLVVSQGTTFKMQGKFWVQIDRGYKRSNNKKGSRKEWKREV